MLMMRRSRQHRDGDKDGHSPINLNVKRVGGDGRLVCALLRRLIAVLVQLKVMKRRQELGL